MPVTIDYYLSLNSPWTYLGSAPFAEIAGRNGATVNIKPCKFGPIFEQTGGLPLPKRSPQRRAYRMMELKRWREVRAFRSISAEYFPCDDARGGPPCDRGQAAGQGCPPAVAGIRPRAVGTRGAARRSAVMSLAAQRAGLDAAALRAGGPSDAELDGLYEQFTQEALNAGVFGAPSYVLPRAKSSGARIGLNCWNAP